MTRKNPKRKSRVRVEAGSLDNFDKVKKSLEKMSYAIVGGHSAVQICHWTKSSLRDNGGCWKEKFYGISSAGCCQMSPSVMWCENQCLHCWRPIEMNLGTDISIDKIENPKEILDKLIEERKKMLMGFRGRRGINIDKFESSLKPSLYTLSLSGEPTLYPKLGEMFKEIRRRGAVSFLVTNGLNPEVLRNLKEDELPTQIAISMNAPNDKLFVKWHRSTKKNAWKKFNETLDVLKSLKGKVRRAVRLTLVKKGGEGNFKDLTNMSDENLKEYVKLIKKAEPDFVHVKGFKSVGYARNRLDYDKQPLHEEVLDFAKKLERELVDYSIAGEYARSCVVMLARKGVKVRIERV